MDIQKDFLKNTLMASYKENLIGLNNDIEEIYRIIYNHKEFNKNDIEELLERIKLIDSLNKTEDLFCNTDGSVRTSRKDTVEIVGAGIAFIVKSQNKTIMKHKAPIPFSYQIDDYSQKTSAQIAEYQAVLSAIMSIKSEHPNPSIINLTIYTDAQTLCKQLNQESRTKHPILMDFKQKISKEISSFKSFTIINIPRESNKEANRMCNSVSSIDS